MRDQDEDLLAFQETAQDNKLFAIDLNDVGSAQEAGAVAVSQDRTQALIRLSLVNKTAVLKCYATSRRRPGRT